MRKHYPCIYAESHKLARVHEMFTLFTNTTKHVHIYIKKLESKTQNLFGNT